MSRNHRFPKLQPWLPVTALVLLGVQMPAFATPEFTIPAVVCVPGDRYTMENELKLKDAGVVQRAYGRDPPPRTRFYFCPVLNFEAAAVQPSWRHLQLMYQDNTAAVGNVVVRLYAKSRGRVATDPPQGSTALISSVSSVPAVGVNVVSARLPAALDFKRFGYYMTLEMAGLSGNASAVVDAHELRLAD